MLFISRQKPFSFSRYLLFHSDLFGHLGKLLDKKAKLIYDVIYWETSNYRVHITQYVKK